MDENMNKGYSIAFVYFNNTPNIGYGAGYVAGAILQAGHSLDFFDTYYISLKRVIKKIIDHDYDFLMVSTNSMQFKKSIKLIEEIKKIKSIPVLMGGIHPTILGDKLLDSYPYIDYICIGEGESMIVEFLNEFGSENFFSVQNLGYRKEGKIILNPIRPPEDLENLPPFPWHLFPKKSIVQKDGSIYVHGSRGCPFHCTYCCNSKYLSLYGNDYLRFRPINQIISDLKLLKNNFHPKWFYFGDEMILSNSNAAVSLFYKIREEIGISFGCMIRAEFINPDIVNILKNTGCRYVAMGVECGDEQFRHNELNRRISNERIIKAFSLLREQGIRTTSFNMIGYPYEYDNSLTDATVQLNKKISPDFVQFSIFYPFPGTKMHERCINLDLIDEKKENLYSDYYSDSIIKGYSLQNKILEINKIFGQRSLKNYLKVFKIFLNKHFPQKN